SKVADSCGLNGPALQAAAQQPDLKMQLQAATDNAIAGGVFGVPTFKIGAELFWGGDRIDALIRYLHGDRIDEQALADFLAKAPLAQRKR
ncbi:MAG TPA: DsbA family protein, partial [Telluria sp.]|nr:DsbA family protein [Telluria sp.]